LVGLVWNYQLRRLNHKLALNEKELINLSEKLKKDIEARKKIGAILKSRDRQLVNLISNLPGFVYRCQNDDYYTMEFISDGCFDITGYQSRDFINNRRIAFSDIILHEELPMIKEKWGIALQKREHFEHEYRITNADETIHWVWERGYCVLDSDGKLTALEGFITDITAQKLAEEKLRNLFENAPVGIFHSVPAGQFITANPPLAKMLGYSSPEELVERISDMTTQIYADPNLRIDQMEKLMKTDGWVHREDVMWRRKDGNLINVDMTGRKVLNPDGSIAYLEGFIEDITEQKKAEMLLRNSEEKYRLITNYASDVIWVLNLERLKYTFISPSIIYLRGFSVEEAMAQSSDESLTTESAISVRNLIAERIQYFIQDPNKEIFYIDEIQQPCKDGRIIWVEVSTKFKYNNVGEIEIIGVSRNIDQRKHFEKELQQNAAQLSELNATKDKFFSIIAHDLKSPFNSIMGFSQLLVEQVNLKDYERLGEFAGIILHSSEKAVSLLMNLMEWSRSQTGRMQFNPKRFDLTDFIKEVTLPFDAIAGQKGIVIKRGLPLNVPVFADKAMLGTVLRNLISNAIKFTNPGGGINLSVTVEKEKLTFSLTDNGIGIPKDAINKIFQFDGNYSTRGTANETGTGLGLILCKEFVEKHNGEIGVESEQGKGSTFRFTLPYNPEPIKNTTDLQPAPSGKIETARKLKILIAEDDEVSEKLIDINVKMISRDILKARTGVEAVEVCRNNPDIDLILMDIRMPEMDGYEATQLIREFNNEVVIIVQTAHGLSGDREKALESGCNDYISKPINKAELLAMISKHCLK
jgi:PAS domain S-box-containing protein